MNRDKIKSEIIQDFLMDYIKNIAKQYRNYFTIDDNMFSDEEMSVFIDCIHKQDSFYDYNLYLVCLDDFKKVCREFIIELDEKLPTKYLIFTENWYEEHKKENGENCYSTCELLFRIK